MSVKITISRSAGVVSFDNPGVAQNDVVFWNNTDSETHYPIPRCSDLKVAAGSTTPAYQPAPNFVAPLNLTYGCAMPGHESESGTITINADTLSPGTLPSGGTAKTATIKISRGDNGAVTFETVDIVQLDSVVWQNDDAEAHFPVPNCSGLKVAPNGVTNAVQLAPSPATGAVMLPMALAYGCAVPGHEDEEGMINVYNTFLVATPPPTVSPAKPYAAVAVVNGGQSPYTINPDPKYDWLTLAETVPAGSSTGISIALNQAPPRALPINITDYALDVTDAQGTRLEQTISLTVAAGTLTAVTPVTLFTKATPYAPSPVATGGTSPYKLTPDTNYPYLTLEETAPAGSSTGVSIVLNADPGTSGPINYQLNVTDANGTNLNQAIQIILI
jgi:hypothetical protein